MEKGHNLGCVSFDPAGYDQRPGRGAAQRIVEILRITGKEADPAIEEIHASRLVAEAKALLATPQGKYTGRARHLSSVEKRARGIAIEILHEYELSLPTLRDVLDFGFGRVQGSTHNQ